MHLDKPAAKVAKRERVCPSEEEIRDGGMETYCRSLGVQSETKKEMKSKVELINIVVSEMLIDESNS